MWWVDTCCINSVSMLKKPECSTEQLQNAFWCQIVGSLKHSAFFIIHREKKEVLMNCSHVLIWILGQFLKICDRHFKKEYRYWCLTSEANIKHHFTKNNLKSVTKCKSYFAFIWKQKDKHNNNNKNHHKLWWMRFVPFTSL